ncbi:MAG: hypothetical protein EB124_05315 [Betaproteobacteria bacterium]|nr:hypothetical protein [Betaproteobacteria bacterium]
MNMITVAILVVLQTGLCIADPCKRQPVLSVDPWNAQPYRETPLAKLKLSVKTAQAACLRGACLGGLVDPGAVPVTKHAGGADVEQLWHRSRPGGLCRRQGLGLHRNAACA